MATYTGVQFSRGHGVVKLVKPSSSACFKISTENVSIYFIFISFSTDIHSIVKHTDNNKHRQ